jgi:hypothetical protein
MYAEAIVDYANKQDPARAEICHALQSSIDAALPQAASKLWHAIPVWFIGTNPVVGYTARKEGVMLMFWNGRHFGEAELRASGTFHMAQIRYDNAAQIDQAKLSGWLAKAATSIWDVTGERAAFVANRRAAKKKTAKKTPAPKKNTKKVAKKARILIPPRRKRSAARKK